MAETPTFVKRVKSKTIRARDENNEEEGVAEVKTVVSNFKNKAKGRSKPQSRLSFGLEADEGGEGDDGGVFQVKKSALSRKMKSGISVSSSPGASITARLEQTSIATRQEGPKYDAAYLQELKASTNSARPPNFDSSRTGEKMDVDSELTFDESEMDGAVIENMEELPLISTHTKETLIPTESSIKAAKEKRDRLRKTGAATGGEEDFISLTVAKRDDFAPGPHPESRLMREDDDLGEGDDDDAEYTGAQERIALSKKGRKEEAKQRKKGIAEMIEEVDEQDEETMEWELAQVKRAVPTSAADSKPLQSRVYKAQPIPTPIAIPSIDSAVLRISSGLASLNTSHSQNASNMASLAQDMIQYTTEQDNIRRQVEETESKRAWFQTFRDRIETLADFFDAKYPALEKLEEEHLSLLKERAEMITKRRTDDNEDDLVLIFGVPLDLQNQEAVTDELGRGLPSNSKPQSAVRKERRQARTQRHTSSSMEEGYATDAALSAGDAADFQQAMTSLKEKVDTELLEDVKAKAYRDPRHGIAVWFREWKEKWPDVYMNAFGGMALVQCWEYWARMEQLRWLPFDHTPRLEEFKWYSQLHDYAHPEMEEDEEVRPEDELPIIMCSNMLIPRLNAIIAGGAFDAYSKPHVLRAIDLAEQVEASLGRENIRYSSLLTSISKAYIRAQSELTAQYQRFYLSADRTRTVFDPEVIQARQRYLRRVSKLLSNVVQWRKYTKERDGLGRLVTELTQLLYDISLPAWDIGGEGVLNKAIRSIPPELIPDAVKSKIS